MRVLYVSQNGMLENLGQSQVLPYLRGLARRGAEIDLVSFEWQGTDNAPIDALAGSLERDGISWTALRRRRDPRLGVKVVESACGVARAMATALLRRPDIVHGRSYLPTAVCDVVASIVPRARLLFDCRGMLGDEYVDAEYWTKDRIEYRLVKTYEGRAFRRAEGVVVLTEALKRWVTEQGWLGPRTSIEAIPCCVDLQRFRFDEAAREKTRRELGLQDAFVILYAGSLGVWYCEEQMARFARMVREGAGEARVAVLVLTPSSSEDLVRHLRREGFAEGDVIVRKVPSPQMAEYLAAGDLALSFIKSCFSKMGSSPTKVAEYLACGLPVVLNGDIGDQADLAAEKDACVVLSSFAAAELAEAVPRALALGRRPLAERASAGRCVADERFGTERVGVARYERLYKAMLR